MADEPRRIVVASGNAHKVAELRAMVQAAIAGYAVVGMHELGDPPDIEESAPDFRGNALLKANAIAAWLRERGGHRDAAVLADDSGICVDALGGAPGVRSARFAGEGKSDAENNLRLVQALEAAGCRESAAHYACVLALARVDEAPWSDREGAAVTFEGRWDVVVRTQARGHGGFGYDPHAWLDDGACTVAELSAADKAERSHRGQAFAALVAWLRARSG